MENRITITICGEDYTFVAEESVSYMQRVGAYVGEKMDAMLKGSKVSRVNAAILTATNIADELFREREMADKFRQQIKDYSTELSNAQNQISELKRELYKAQNNQNKGPQNNRK